MAGRPRTMARRVEQLLERQSVLVAELQRLMPVQYCDPTDDTLGGCWRRAVESSDRAHEYLLDLWSILECKAERAEARAKGARTVADMCSLVDDFDAANSESAVAD